MGTRLVEEEKLHINILEIKAIQMTLETFKERLIGEDLFFMNDNASVIAYSKKKGVALSMDMCRMTQGIIG